MIKKDPVKNITLTLLICSSVFLCLYIFMNGNSGFMTKIISAFAPARPSFDMPLSSVIKPARIVITANGKRSVLTGGSPSFEKASDEIVKLLSGLNITGDASFKELEPSELFKAVKFKSVLIDYGGEIPEPFWRQLCSLKTAVGGTEHVRAFLLVPGDNVSGKLQLIIPDAQSGKGFLLQTANLNEYINGFFDKNMSGSDTGLYPFSFELNFDNTGGSMHRITQKLILDSLVSVNLNQSSLPSVKTNPLPANPSQEQLEGIVGLFGFRTGASKRYVEMNNAVQYVENYATLKISPDGLIEYQAIEGEKGLQLFETAKDNNQSEKDIQCLVNSAGFVQGLIRQAGAQGGSLQFSDMSYNKNSGLYTFSFDYTVNGVPYYINTAETAVITSHAAEIAVLGGRVQMLRLYVRSFETAKSSLTVPPLIKSLDKLDIKDPAKSIEITDAFLAYIEQNFTPSPFWCSRQKTVNGIVPMN